MQAWTVHFEPLKYRDNYREGVQRLVQNRVRRSHKAPLRSARADGSLLRQLEAEALSGELCLANAGDGQKGTKGAAS